MSSNLAKRIRVALWGVPALIAVAWFGDWYFAAAVTVTAVAIVHELSNLLKRKGLVMGRWVIPSLALAIPTIAHLFGPLGIAISLWASLLLIGASSLEYDTTEGTGRFIAGLFIVGYVVLPFSTIILLRDALEGQQRLVATTVTLMVIGGVWITDTGAYTFGRLFGRHPLAPRISPKKTIEGAIGGVVSAVLFVWGWGFFFDDLIPWPHRLGIGVVLGVMAGIGDLVQSMMKRSVSIKDSGNLLPGHGGVFDRFDSLLFVAPALYLYLLLIGAIPLG